LIFDSWIIHLFPADFSSLIYCSPFLLIFHPWFTLLHSCWSFIPELFIFFLLIFHPWIVHLFSCWFFIPDLLFFFPADVSSLIYSSSFLLTFHSSITLLCFLLIFHPSFTLFLSCWFFIHHSLISKSKELRIFFKTSHVA
jgi:hypothetical protein